MKMHFPFLSRRVSCGLLAGRNVGRLQHIARSSVFLVTVLICLSAQSWATAPILDNATISFEERDGRVKLAIEQTDSTKKLVVSFDAEKIAKVRTDSDADLQVVSRLNPILFLVVANEIAKSPTASKQAADQLSAALTTIVGSPTNLAVDAKVEGIPKGSRSLAIQKVIPDRADPKAFDCSTSGIKSVTFDGRNMESIRLNIAQLISYWDQSTDLIDRTLDQKGLASADQAAREWDNWMRESKPENDIQFIADLVRKLMRGDAFVLNVTHQSVAIGCNPNRSIRSFDELSKVPGYDFSGYADLILLINSERFTLRNQLTDIRELSKATLAITAESASALTNVRYDGDNSQFLPIVVSANPRFAALLSDSAKDKQKQLVGTYKIAIDPYEWVHIRPTVGVIYSFVKTPKYSTQKDANGVVAVDASHSDEAEFSGVVAVEFVPDRYLRAQTQLFVQLGVAPESDHRAFLLGLGVHRYKSFTISLGAIYQRIDKLGEGLQVGQVIADEAALKVDKEYKAGFYVGIGVKFD